MIRKVSSGKSIGALVDYLTTERDGARDSERDRRVAWTATRNLATDDPRTAAAIMDATAFQNPRTVDPVYHVALSFHPTDPVDRPRMATIATRVLTDLGLQDHQVVIVAHGDRPHPHVHLAVNRIHPETFRAWNRWHDYAVIDRSLRAIEREFGLREVDDRATSREEHVSTDPNDRPRRHLALDDTRERAGSTPLADAERLAHAYADAKSRADAAADASSAAQAARAQADQWQRATARAQSAIAEFEHALGTLYTDPRRATDRIFAHADKVGPVSAFEEMLYRPRTYGPVRADAAATPDVIATVADRGYEAHRAVRTVNDLARSYGLSDISLTDVGGVLSHRAATADRAATEARDAARDSFTSRHALARALRHLSPDELTRLRHALTPTQWSIVRPIADRVRGAALGREEHAR